MDCVVFLGLTRVVVSNGAGNFSKGVRLGAELLGASSFYVLSRIVYQSFP